MNTSTLMTKVLLPQRREDILRRQRLLDRLYDLVDRKMVVVSAPAGYGKTTLLVDFAHDLEHPVCWYALDESDRDPHVFLEHLVLSLHHRFPGFGERTRRALVTSPNLGHGAPGVITELLNEIVEAIPRWFVVVLDDYHRLGEAPEVGAILARCLAHLGDQFLFIIASRTFPELPSTIQLTAKDELGGLDQDDLRFRADEIQALIAQNYGLHIPKQEAENLADQSEGWITGLLLSAHTMWQDIVRKLVRARTSDTPVYEYLAQEVFARQDPPIQAFLMASSTLQEMGPELCREALGLEEAADLLALLDDRNLFITRLEGEWYRYHHLFREYLQARLRRENKAAWRELHQRAAGWFALRQQPEKAVYHYLVVDDHEVAMRTMEAAAQDTFYAGRLETLMVWGTALPDTLRERAPRLALFQSRAADVLGQWEESLALTEVAERGYRARGDDRGLAYALLHRCQVWREQGRLHEALALGQQVLAQVEQVGVLVVYEAHRVIGLTCLAMGQLKEGEEHLRQALAYSEEQGSDFERSSVLHALADCLWHQGRRPEAVAVLRRAVAIQRQLDSPSALSGTLNDLGFYLYSNGEYNEALSLVREALELARRSGHRRNEALALVSQGELLRDLGALEQAARALEEGLAIADELGHEFLSAYGREALGLMHRYGGNYDLARGAIEKAVESAERQQSQHQLGRYEASLGMVLAEAGEMEVGLAKLAQACERLERSGAQSELARAQFFTAWLLFRAGREEDALVRFQQLLAAENWSGQAPLFVVEGQRALPLLEYAHSHGHGDEQLTALLGKVRAFEHTTQAILRQPSDSQTEDGVGAGENLRIFGFGPGHVERADRSIPSSEWETESARTLLFYLLTHSSRSRDQIVAAFWPDLPRHRVKATFHVTKFRLNRALGQEATYFDGRGYRVHPDLDYWFDVGEFERLLAGTGQERRLTRLQQAVALYQGDFLEDCYADWAVPHRERLREQYLRALDELARRLIARRQYQQAIQVLHRGLEIEDLRENFHRHLMRAYTLSGRRSQAITQYQRCAEILERELGLAPSSETTLLYDRILSGMPLD